MITERARLEAAGVERLVLPRAKRNKNKPIKM